MREHLEVAWKLSRPVALRWSKTAVSVANRSGRPKSVQIGCTVLENHAISEIARAPAPDPSAEVRRVLAAT